MSVGMGKFDSVEAIIAYRWMLDGGGDDSITFGEDSGEWAERFNLDDNDRADVEGMLTRSMGESWRAELLEECSHWSPRISETYVANAHHGFDCFDDSHDVPCPTIETADHQHVEVIRDALDNLHSSAGIILTGDDRGFVYAESFSSLASLSAEWLRLQGVSDDIEREGMREEHAEWVTSPRYSSHEQDDCEWCAPVEGFAISARVNWKGIASRVVGFDSGSLIVVMVGDDARRVIDPENITTIGDDYCHECGDINCRGDGRATDADE